MTMPSNPIPFRADDEEETDKDISNAGAAMMNKFLDARTVLIFGGVDQKMAERISMQLLYLDHVSNEPIRVIVNSPGGHVESGDTIHDLISFIASPVAMIGTGWVASIATHIFLSVPAERRFCLPNTRFLIHQPSGGARGMASDIEIQAREILRIKKRMNDLYVKYTGQSLDDIEKAMDRDTFLEADEAMKFGIVDKVFETRPENDGGDAEGSGGAPE